MDKQKERISKRDYTVLIITIVFILMTFTTTAFALFSDAVNDDITITSGSLKINGQYQYLLNGKEISEVTYLLPGDLVVIKVNVQNMGNQEAWIREKISIDIIDEAFLQYIKIYDGNITLPEIVNNQELSFVENSVVSSSKILGHSEITNENADYQNGEYEVFYTLYFDINADNNAQNKVFKIKIETQALQYANNVSLPLESAWETVSSTNVW